MYQVFEAEAPVSKAVMPQLDSVPLLGTTNGQSVRGSDFTTQPSGRAEADQPRPWQRKKESPMLTVPKKQYRVRTSPGETIERDT